MDSFRELQELIVWVRILMQLLGSPCRQSISVKRPNCWLPQQAGIKPILMELKSKKMKSLLLFWCFQSFTASENYSLSMTRSTCDDHYSVIAVEAKTKFFSPWVNSFGASPWNHLIGCKQRKKIAGFLCFCFSKLLKFSRLIFPVNFVLATPLCLWLLHHSSNQQFFG